MYGIWCARIDGQEPPVWMKEHTVRVEYATAAEAERHAESVRAWVGGPINTAMHYEVREIPAGE